MLRRREGEKREEKAEFDIKDGSQRMRANLDREGRRMLNGKGKQMGR